MNKTEKPYARLQLVLENIAPAITTEPERLIDCVLTRLKALDTRIRRDLPKLVDQLSEIEMKITPTGVCVDYKVGFGESGCKGQLNVAIPGRPVFDSLTAKQLERVVAFYKELGAMGIHVQIPRSSGKSSGLTPFSVIRVLVDGGIKFDFTNQTKMSQLKKVEGVVDVDFTVVPCPKEDWKTTYNPSAAGVY